MLIGCNYGNQNPNKQHINHYISILQKEYTIYLTLKYEFIK